MSKGGFGFVAATLIGAAIFIGAGFYRAYSYQTWRLDADARLAIAREDALAEAHARRAARLQGKATMAVVALEKKIPEGVEEGDIDGVHFKRTKDVTGFRLTFAPASRHPEPAQDFSDPILTWRPRYDRSNP
jgi:hypothetical protein